MDHVKPAGNCPVDLPLGQLPEPDLHEGVVVLRKNGKYAGTDDGYTAETVLSLLSAERERCVPDVDELAQHIRWLNGSNKIGAGRLAEQLVEWLRSRA